MTAYRIPPRDSQLRIGDLERDITCTELARHFSAGRISENEMDARTSAALTAETRGELYDLLGDLPRPNTPSSQVPHAHLTRRGPVRVQDAIVGFLSISAILSLGGLMLLLLGSFPGGALLLFLGALAGSVSTFGAWYFMNRRDEPRCTCDCGRHWRTI